MFQAAFAEPGHGTRGAQKFKEREIMANAQAPSGLQSMDKTPAYAWTILTVLCAASVASALNQFKVPPVLPVLIREFNLNLGNAGMLMSLFSVTGLVLALPAGFIQQRLGLKATGLIAVGALFIGTALGTCSSTMHLMLASRFIEGVGLGLITVVAPAAISLWFPEAKRGTPLGLWTTCMPVGNIVTLNLAPWLAKLGGWQLVWKIGAIIALAAFILFWRLFRMPKPEEAGEMLPADSSKIKTGKQIGYGKAMLNASLWLIALQFCCYNVICLALGTYYPTFLNSVRNYTLPVASFISSLGTITAVFSQPLGGYLSDRLGTRRIPIIISSVLMGLICLFLFVTSGWMIPALIIALGVIAGIIVPASFAAVPEVMPSRELAGSGMAVLALGQNLGMFIGPIMFGLLAESIGWAGAGYMLVPVCATSAIAIWLAKFR
jgi:MFS family permease